MHYYKVIKANGKVLLDYSANSAPCFAKYNYCAFSKNSFYNGTNTIEIYIKKNSLQEKFSIYQLNSKKENKAFSRRQIKLHLERLSRCGFKMSLTENNLKYIITLREQDYINLTHVRIALDFIRLLFEVGQIRIMRRYYRIPLQYKKKFDYLEILQLISANLAGKISGHYLPGPGYTLVKGKAFTSKEIIQALNNKTKHNEGSYVLWNQIFEDKKYKVIFLKEEEKKKITKWNPAKPGRLEKIQELLAQD